MLSHLHKTRETGFTLIELLTVIIIIGILAAVAIPVFSSQRGRAQDSQTISDVRNMVTAAETLLADRTKSVSDLSQSSVEFASSKNVLWNIKGNTTTNGYCIAAYNASGKDYNSSTSLLTYDSTGGGLKKNGSSCAGTDAANNSNTPVPTSSTASGTVAASNDPRVAYSASLADNPVAFYSLSEANGTTNVTDLSANNTAGATVSNVTLGAAGPNGAITGASFNGATPSYISLPVGSSVGSGSFTIESWVKVSAINNNYQTIYERGTVGVNGYVFYVRNGYVGLGTNAAYNTSNTQLTPNTWYHVAVVYNGSTANFYVNGVSTQNITSSPSNYTSPSNSVRIGSHSNGSEAFTGSIAGVGVYNSTLSGTQIANHYNSSK